MCWMQLHKAIANYIYLLIASHTQAILKRILIAFSFLLDWLPQQVFKKKFFLTIYSQLGEHMDSCLSLGS